jgi:F0F1-type ATP synthase membrane subunit b/b'
MYLDPGFGSMVLQLVLAGVLGAGVIIRIFWKRIKGIFQKKQDVVSEISDDIDYGNED